MNQDSLSGPACADVRKLEFLCRLSPVTQVDPTSCRWNSQLAWTPPSFEQVCAVMTARFAGSTNLAQRRRRRLAQDAPGLHAGTGHSRQSRSSSDSGSNVVEDFLNAVPRLPRETMVPGNWKVIGALGILGFLAWAAIVWMGFSSVPEQMGIGDLAVLPGGPFSRYFSTVALVLTAQLSLLIYWHRSCSRTDFLGRYRIWGWVGAFWCLICLAHVTQIHIPIISYLSHYMVINCWRGPTLVWFVPLAVGVLTVYRLAAREMNPSRPSAFFWNIAFGIGLLLAAMHFGLELLLPKEIRPASVAAVAMLWHFALAFTCLVHARHVTHVTNEVGRKRPTITVRISRGLTPQLTKVGERVLSVRLPKRLRRHHQESTNDSNTEKLPAKLRSKAASTAVAPPIEKVRKKPALESNSTPAADSTPSKSWKERLGFSMLDRWSKKKNEVENSGEDVAKVKPERNRTASAPVENVRTKQEATSAAEEATAPAQSWKQRLGFSLMDRLSRKKGEDGTSGEERAQSKPERKKSVGEKPVESRPVIEKKAPAADSKKADDASKTDDASTGPSWGQRLGKSLLGGWPKRVDASTAEQSAVPAPHVKVEARKPETKTETVPTAAAKPAGSASKSVTPPVVKPSPKQELPAALQRSEEYEEDEGDSDEDFGGMSSRERKRQKKQARQQGR